MPQAFDGVRSSSISSYSLCSQLAPTHQDRATRVNIALPLASAGRVSRILMLNSITHVL